MLAGLILLCAYLLLRTQLYAVILIVILTIAFQIYSLIKYVDKTNKDLQRFLDAIKYEDFSQTFSGGDLGDSFRELKNTFNDVLKKFQRTRAEKEEHHRYLQTVVQHIGIGLISFQPDGEVQLINTAAKRLLKVNQLKNIKVLSSWSPELVSALFKLTPGEKTLIKIVDNHELLWLAIYATAFILHKQKYTLVSLQNIQPELEEKEMEAWQNLIRVLTHEIMNSITPIASLASTVNGLLGDCRQGKKDCVNFDPEVLEDISRATQTIEKRSQGLLNFVQSYRKLYRIPKPNFQIFQISSLFERIRQLMSQQMTENKIQFRTKIEPESLELTADPEMVEQVLINLLLNSIAALKNAANKKIELTAGLNKRGNVILQLKDNGEGIENEILDKIFIPFFTTRQDGSGIGLSLSRQIMRLHRGNISAISNPGIETTFTLRF